MSVNKKVNPFLVFDFETGGIDKKKNLHSNVHPVTEFAGILIEGGTLNVIDRFECVIKPYDSNLIYSESTENIEILSREYCEENGVSIKHLVEGICNLCKKGKESRGKFIKPVLVAHNGDYDRQFIQQVFSYTSKVREMPKYFECNNDHNKNIIPHVIDTIFMCKMMWGMDELMPSFNLQACCKKANIDIVNAHRAMPDVEALVELFRFLVLGMGSGKKEENRFRTKFQF